MAIGYARTESVNRAVRANGKQGNAVASSAYAARAKMVDESTGAVYDFRRLAEGSPPILLPVVVPDGQPGIERQELWTKAEQAERQHNSTVARSMIGALPNELDADAQQRICYRVAEFMARAHGVAVDAAIHRDAGNNHVHFLFTSRRYKDGELGAKTRELDVKGSASKALRAIRKYWQDGCNFELEAAGFAERIDMRSYEDRGENKLGQIHLGSDAWHHQERAGGNDKAARNEARKSGHKAVEAEQLAEEYEAQAKACEAKANAHRLEAETVKAEDQRKAFPDYYDSIFLTTEEAAVLAKNKKPEPTPPPKPPAFKSPITHPIFIMPEEVAAKRLYASLYRFMGGDIPADDLIADIGQFRSPDQLAMLNHADANGNRFSHLSAAVLNKLEREANGQPGKLIAVRRFLKACNEIEKTWLNSGGKLDQKAYNGSGQGPAAVRADGLGDWMERQRATELLRAIDGVSTGALSDEAFFAIAGKMRSPETAVCFDGVTVDGKSLDDLLRQLWKSPSGKTNSNLMAVVVKAMKASMETGRMEQDFDKLAKLAAAALPAAPPPQPTASMTPWAAPTPPMPRTGTARISAHQPRAPRSPVGTPVRVAYKPANRQRTAPGSGTKWRAGYAQLERMSRNQVGHGMAKLPLDHSIIQMPISPAIGGVESALPLAEVARRAAPASQQNLKPGMWLIPPGASPQEAAAIQAHNRDLMNATASEFSKKFTRD